MSGSDSEVSHLSSSVCGKASFLKQAYNTEQDLGMDSRVVLDMFISYVCGIAK